METQAGLVEALLSSWRPRCSKRLLFFDPGVISRFTRRGFADILRALGAIAERSLPTIQRPSSRGRPDVKRTRYRLAVQLWDWETEKEWWWNHIQRCFPTWARSKRLRMHFLTREYMSFYMAIMRLFINDPLNSPR